MQILIASAALWLTPVTVDRSNAESARIVAFEPVKGSFKVGEQRIVRMRGVRERPNPKGGPNTKLPLANDALVKILESHTDHWMIEVTLKVPEGPDISDATKKAVAQQIEQFPTPMRIRLSPEGEMKIQNLEEVLEAAYNAVRVSTPRLMRAEGRDVTPEQVEQVIESMKKMYSDPEKANTMLLNNYSFWFAHLGADGEDGKPYEVEQLMPAPIGDGLLGATSTVTLSKADDTHGKCVMVTKPDEADLKKIVLGIMEQFKAAPKDKPPPDEAELAKWDLKTTVTVTTEFEASSGWPRKSAKNKRVELKTPTEARTQGDLVECSFEKVKE